MRSRGFSEAAIYGALIGINDTQCQPPLSTDEVRQIASSCARYDVTQHVNGTTPQPTGTPIQAPTTPYGDIYYAEWFIKLYGDRWRYCAVWKSWLHWIGTHWERDTQGHIMEDARATLRHVGHMAIDTDNAALIKHYSRSMNHQPLQRMLQQASTLPGVSITPSVLDQYPWLLNCRNGTLDLKTGTLLAHEKTHYLTRCLTLDYEPDAQAPTWNTFLWRIMGGTVEADSEDDTAATLDTRTANDARATRLITFLQRALGYACSGDTSEECLFLFHGSGRNGKSKLLTTMQHLLGPYAKTADMQSFLHRDRETVRNDLADLNATRFVCASEVNEGSRFAEGLIKQLTGGDAIKARFLFQEYFEFTPEFKLFLAFNHKPTIRGTDDAIWARIRLVPFTVTIPPDEQDKHLSDKLLTELPGILAWCVQGCLAWQQDGLSEPPEVTEATQEYRHESDYLQRFIDEHCLVGDAYRAEASALYAAYKRWAEANGEYVQTQTRFGRDLEQKKFHKKPGHANKQFREGLGLKEANAS
jgi:putative DNA primase/helicase